MAAFFSGEAPKADEDQEKPRPAPTIKPQGDDPTTFTTGNGNGGRFAPVIVNPDAGTVSSVQRTAFSGTLGVASQQLRVAVTNLTPAQCADGGTPWSWDQAASACACLPTSASGGSHAWSCGSIRCASKHGSRSSARKRKPRTSWCRRR